MIARLLGVVVAFVGGATGVAQQGEMTVRLRSLAPFVTPWLQVPGETYTAMPGDAAIDMPQGLDTMSEPNAPDWLVELLRQRHHEAIDAGRLAILNTNAAGDEGVAICELVLRGRAADVEACDRELDAIAAAMGRPIEITAFRLPLGEGVLPATTWDAATVQKALKDRPPLWTAHGRTRSGGALRLAQERGIGILRDLDTEVAGGTHISDPKVDTAFAGLRATLVVDAMPGDELVLRGSWLLSEPIALHEQSAGDCGLIDLPDHRNAWVTFAGRVPSGGALVVAGRGGPVGPEGFLLVLGARFLAPPPTDVAPDLLVRPIGALLAGRAVWPRLGYPVPGDDSPSFGIAPCNGGLSANGLIDVLAMPPGAVELAGSVLVLHGDAEASARADALLRALFANLTPATLRSRITAEGGSPLELVQPLLAGRSAAAFVGRERSVIRDQEVEISGSISGSNPVVGIVRSGLWLGAIASRGGAGWHMTGSWSIAAYDEPRVREHSEKPRMILHLVDYRTTTLPWDAPMPLHHEHQLGDGPAWRAGGVATRVSVQLAAP